MFSEVYQDLFVSMWIVGLQALNRELLSFFGYEQKKENGGKVFWGVTEVKDGGVKSWRIS